MGTVWVEAFQKVLGKRIQGLVVVQHSHAPNRQVFLVFDDSSHFELFGDIEGCKGIDPGGLPEIREHLRGSPGARVLLDVAAD